MCGGNSLQGMLVKVRSFAKAALINLQAVLNAKLKAGDWLVVVGAGGGLGHLAGTIGPSSESLR